MKKQLLLSLLLVATPAFASEGDAPVLSTPGFVEKAKDFWVEKSSAASQWKSEQCAKVAQFRDTVSEKASMACAKAAQLKNAAYEKATTAKEYAQDFWNADRDTKTSIAKHLFVTAKEFAANNKLNLGGSALAAVAAYNILSQIPVFNTEKNHPFLYGKKIKETGLKKFAKVGTKLALSSALFAYLVATERPDQAADWVKGFLAKKDTVSPIA